METMTRATLVIATLAWLASVSCSSDPLDPNGKKEIEFLAGGHLTDSALGRPSQLITVRVRSTGSGIPVRFDGVPSPLGGQFVTVSPTATESFLDGFEDTTDASAQISARVWMGSKAGTHYVRVSVPSLGLVDSAEMTVTAASAWSLAIEPTRTTLLVGESQTIQVVGVADMWGNQRTGDVVTFRALDPGVTVSGPTVTGARFGVSSVEAKTGNAVAGLYVTVVPDGHLVSVSGIGAVTYRTNGSDRHTVGHQSIYVPFGVDYTTHGNLVVYDLGVDLVVANETAVVRVIPGPLGAPRLPRFSPDGRFIYFSRQTGVNWDLRRIAVDGTGDTLIVGGGAVFPAASPSPDGTRLAYISPTNGLRILDLATGGSTQIATEATAPAWAPNGQEIAYVDGLGLLRIVKPDGTLLRTLNTPALQYNPGIAWSRDSHWLVAGGLVLNIVDAATGLALPLTFGGGPTAWK